MLLTISKTTDLLLGLFVLQLNFFFSTWFQYCNCVKTENNVANQFIDHFFLSRHSGDAVWAH